MINEELMDKFFEKGYFLSPETLSDEKLDYEKLYGYLINKHQNNGSELLMINNDIINQFNNEFKPVVEPLNIENIAKLLIEKEEPKVIVTAPKKDYRDDIETNIEVINNYTIKNEKKTVSSFVNYYTSRYEKIKNMFLNRGDIKDVVSINKIEDETISIIGLVKEVSFTKAGNCLIELEDTTDSIKVLISPRSQDFIKTQKLVQDEVIAISGKKSGRFFYCDKISFPEFNKKEPKNSPDDVIVAFASDTHVGSNMFLEEKLNKFFDWLNLKIGSEKQKQLASKVKYIVVPGDLVDGIGVYPEQEKELQITDIYKQYAKFAELFERVPDTVELILSPGNHDAVRAAEPQPALYKDFAEPIYKMAKKVTMLSNPCYINLHKKDNYPGVNTLIYHGYSFDHYIAEVPFLRKYKYDRIDLLLEFLLDKRHLSPTHGSTVYVPESEDNMVIDKVPDVFATGHIHKAKVGIYKGVITLSSSCFQGRTAFQEKVGHVPEPGKIPLLNLKTNELKLMEF